MRSRKPTRQFGYVQHPGYGLAPEDVFPIFVAAERGDPRRQVALFDDLLERDGTTRNLFEQRAGAVSGKPFVIQSASERPEDEDAAAALRESFDRVPDVARFFEHQLSFNCHGYAASEIDWVYRHGQVEIAGFEHAHADRFRIATPSHTPGDTRPDDLLLVTDQAPMGEALAPGKWVVSRRPGTLPLARRGLMRTCAWYSMFKLFAIKDWQVYAARFGIPLPIAKVTDWDDQVSKHIAQEVISRLGDDGGGVMPKDFELEIKDGVRASSSSGMGIHGSLVAFCDAENSRTVYGSTLNNDNGQAGGASYALGTTHAGVRWENVIRDAVFLQEAWRRDIAVPFMHYNNLPGAPPRLRIQVVQSLTPEQIVKTADSFANKLGIPLSVQQLREMVGFREPKDGKDTAAGNPPKKPGTGQEVSA